MIHLVDITTIRTYAVPVLIKSNQLKRAVRKEFCHLKMQASFDDKTKDNGESKEFIKKDTVHSGIKENSEKPNNPKGITLNLIVDSLEPLSEATLKKISLFVEKEERRLMDRKSEKEKQHEGYLADKLNFYQEDLLTKPINKDLDEFRSKILATHEDVLHPKQGNFYDGTNGKSINKGIDKLYRQMYLYTTLNREDVSLDDLQKSAKVYYNFNSIWHNDFGESVFNHLEKEFKKFNINLRDQFNDKEQYSDADFYKGNGVKTEEQKKKHQEFIGDKLKFFNEDEMENSVGISGHLEIFKDEIMNGYKSINDPKKGEFYDGKNNKEIDVKIKNLEKQVNMYKKLNKEVVSIDELEVAKKEYYQKDNLENKTFGVSVIVHLENEIVHRSFVNRQEGKENLKYRHPESFQEHRL